jgi:hypothetical protein
MNYESEALEQLADARKTAGMGTEKNLTASLTGAVVWALLAVAGNVANLVEVLEEHFEKTDGGQSS